MVEDTSITGVCHLFMDGDKLFSPNRAPFGSIECASLEGGQLLLDEMLRWAESNGYQKITIKHYPNIYGEVVEDLLIHNGFEVDLEEVNYHINISEKPFEEVIHRSKKKKLRNVEEFIFEISTKEKLREIYEIVVSNRKQKDYPVTLSFEQLEAEINQSPDRFILFTLKKDLRYIATVIAIQVTSKVIYSFYPADDYDYRKFSPMVYLYDCIYEYCQKNGVETLDLGIATEDGIPNEGLMFFKKHMGGIATPKRTYVKNLV